MTSIAKIFGGLLVGLASLSSADADAAAVVAFLSAVQQILILPVATAAVGFLLHPGASLLKHRTLEYLLPRLLVVVNWKAKLVRSPNGHCIIEGSQELREGRHGQEEGLRKEVGVHVRFLIHHPKSACKYRQQEIKEGQKEEFVEAGRNEANQPNVKRIGLFQMPVQTSCYSELVAAAQQKKERRASGRGGANVIIEDASYNRIDNQQPDEKGELPQVPHAGAAADSNGRKHS